MYLKGDRELIESRLKARRGHYMPASLLDSQFSTLEPPTDDEKPIVVGVAQPLEAILTQAELSLGIAKG